LKVLGKQGERSFDRNGWYRKLGDFHKAGRMKETGIFLELKTREGKSTVGSRKLRKRGRALGQRKGGLGAQGGEWALTGGHGNSTNFITSTNIGGRVSTVVSVGGKAGGRCPLWSPGKTLQEIS